MKVMIYGLLDPRTSKFRYVGATTNPEARMKHWMRCPVYSCGNPLLSKWLQDLKDAQNPPVFVNLEEFICENNQEMYERETEWIEHACQLEWPILNMLKVVDKVSDLQKIHSLHRQREIEKARQQVARVVEKQDPHEDQILAQQKNLEAGIRSFSDN